MLRSDVSVPPLSAVDHEQFTELGYLVLPGFLAPELLDRMRTEVDLWVDGGWRARSIASCVDPETHGLPPKVEVEMPAHGEVIAHPGLLTVIEQLMGSSFVFHHMHSDRHEPDRPGKPWHHDYEQRPRNVDREATMIHTLHYLDGLDPDVASLVVLPGSHRQVMEKDAHTDLGERELPGEVVIEELPPGSTVVLHSALLHARRARPRPAGRDRYFVDVSYCQTSTVWPPVKPYWRHILERARELNLDDGQWPELFADRHFTEYAAAAQR